MRSFWPQVADPNKCRCGGPRWSAEARRLLDPAGPRLERTTVLDGDPLAALPEPKQQPGGDAQAHGCPCWPPLRPPRGLVEEYGLLVFPNNVGAGKRLFTEDARHSRVHCARV